MSECGQRTSNSKKGVFVQHDVQSAVNLGRRESAGIHRVHRTDSLTICEVGSIVQIEENMNDAKMFEGVLLYYRYEIQLGKT